jgi:hypothetical protein
MSQPDKLAEATTIEEYKCVGCSYSWKNADSVVKHIIKGNKVFFWIPEV